MQMSIEINIFSKTKVEGSEVVWNIFTNSSWFLHRYLMRQYGWGGRMLAKSERGNPDADKTSTLLVTNIITKPRAIVTKLSSPHH